MYGKVIILALLAISTCYAQTPTCGNVQIPQMAPAQIWNPYAWILPGAIAWSDCTTAYYNSIQNSMTQLSNQLYNAGPPQPTQQIPQQNQQQPQQNQQQPQTNQQQPQTNQQQPQQNQQQPQTNQQQPQTNQQQPQTNQQQPQTNQQQPQTNPQQPQTNPLQPQTTQ